MSSDSPPIDWDKMHCTDPIDFFGFPIAVGDQLIKPEVHASSAIPCRRTVTRILNGRIYLDNSHVPIMYPRRCINISCLRSADLGQYRIR